MEMEARRRTSANHRFLEDSKMSFREVFDFAFKSHVPTLQALAEELGKAQVFESLKKVAFQSALTAGLAAAREVPCNDFATFNAWARESSRFWKHVLTFEVVEDTPQAFEITVTECLWAKTFRDLAAGELGCLLICHPDYAYCEGFNPRITMSRSKTLMEGDNCCNHRWVWSK